MANGSVTPLRSRLPSDPNDRAFMLADNIDHLATKIDTLDTKLDNLAQSHDEAEKRALNRFIAILSSVSVAIVLLLVDIITRGAGG